MGPDSNSGRIFDKATQSFLGSPTSALHLSLLRILIPFWCLYTSLGENVISLSTLDAKLFIPVSFYKYLPELTLPHLSWYLYQGFRVALALLMVGVCSRVAAAFCLVVGTYLMGLSYNLGYSAHNLNILPFIFLALALSPCSDYLSLSRLVMGRKIRSILAYSLPVHFIRILLVFIYFSAATQKLRESGFDFFMTDHLAIKLAQSGQSFSLWLSEHALLCQSIAFAALLVQLLAPLALWWKTRFFVIVLFFFQLGTSLIGAHFPLYSVLFFLWIPFRKLIRFTPIFNETNPRPLFLVKSFYLYSAIVMLFGLSSLARYEAWPFSHFPMYADTSYIENGLVRYRLKLKMKDGSEVFYHELAKNRFAFPARRVHAYFRAQEKLQNIPQALENLYWSFLKTEPTLSELELCRQEWLPVTPESVRQDIPCQTIHSFGAR